MREDERAAAARGAPSAEPDSDVKPVLVNGIRQSMQQWARRAPAKEKIQLAGLAGNLTEIAEFPVRWTEIEAASESLEAHRAGFEALLADEQALVERGRKLFAEQRFARLRFRAADIQRAFSAVGYLSFAVVDDRTFETMRKAILFLADQKMGMDGLEGG